MKRMLKDWAVALCMGLLIFSAIQCLQPKPQIPEIAPDFKVTTVDGDLIHLERLRGRAVVLNFWASWCLPCEVEHPILMGLSKKSDFIIIGVNYKDTDEGSAKFLNEKGNPYDLVVIDDEGMMGIEMGLTGVPETFVVNEEGKIIYRIVGPINNENKF